MNKRAMGKTLLPVRIALPVFASDALSSVAYAPDEILLTLAFAGIAASTMSLWVGIAVVLVLMVVVMSYRQTVHAYPSGGGDYEVATANLGPRAGLTVASSLLVDYVLTVAVSISSGAHYITAAWPQMVGWEVPIAVSVVALLALLNLRGLRESGTAFAIPTYVYMFSIGLMLVVGLFKEFTGSLGDAPTAAYEVVPAVGYDAGLAGIAGFFLILRAFSSGCAALTGVEAIANGVPAMQKPKSKNAATTLALLGMISTAMMLCILYLAKQTGAKVVEDPSSQLLLDSQPLAESIKIDPVISQIAATVFASSRPLFLLITIVTGLILVLAANTAFNGFPQLASVLSRDSFLPRQLYKRGDRLTYSNGIIVLAVASAVLIAATEAEVTRLIQMYIVGVFISFSMSQLGMMRHWTRELRTCSQVKRRNQMRRSRVINVVGFAVTFTVLIVVVLTKFIHGAWVAILLMMIVYFMMLGISQHYKSSEQYLSVDDWDGARALPSRAHSLVLVSKMHRPTMRAIAYAAAANPATLELVNVNIEDAKTKALQKQWENAGIDIPLTILGSPYRDITLPVTQHVRTLRRRSPRDLIVFYIPYFLVEHWWQNLLHNHSATRLRRELQYIPGVVVTLVPWRFHGVMEPGPVLGERLRAPEEAQVHGGASSDTTENTNDSHHWFNKVSLHWPSRKKMLAKTQDNDTSDGKNRKNSMYKSPLSFLQPPSFHVSSKARNERRQRQDNRDTQKPHTGQEPPEVTK
ncbi:MAG: APC family permease [Actinomycetaceae bacterium]|nr:APC family permease [Actinomycetaceae bacterium]